MKIYCFDIEATDREEILELSFYDAVSQTELFHSYFRPRSTAWPDSQKVHHITPAFVRDKPRFEACREEVQRIVDEADYLLGFAVDNDLRYLERAGIKLPDSGKVLDVRDWYWYCRCRGEEKSPGTTPSLIICANEMGIEFDENSAHSASVDTLFTVRVFNAVVAEFSASVIPDAGLETVVPKFREVYDAEVAAYRERQAAGYLCLEKVREGYRLKNRATPPEKAGVVYVAVKSRYLGEHEVRDRFQKRLMPGSAVYRLKDSDIAWFRSYSNRYEAEREAFYRHLSRSNAVRNASLGFRFG